MKPFVNKEINFQVFLDVLSDKVDPQRVSLSFQQVREVELGRHGIPWIIINILMLFSQESEDDIIQKKIEQGISDTPSFQKQITIQKQKEKIDLTAMAESQEIRQIRNTFGKHINFNVYE